MNCKSISLISKLHLTFKTVTLVSHSISGHHFSPLALLTCKLSSIDFQKNLERQFYKDITNTRNAKIVCIVIVLQLHVINYNFYSAVMPISNSISTGIKTWKPVKWTILYSHILLNTYQNMYH
jgi:hypothetical protein